MEERRLLVAVVLSLLVLTGYSLLFSPHPKAPEPPASPALPAGTEAAPTVPPPAPEVTPSATPVPTPTPTPVAEVEPVAAAEEKRVEVAAPSYSVAFTNRGARLLSWTLAKYPDARGHAEEMVPAVGSGPRPLDIETGDSALDARLREALFEPSTDLLRVRGTEGQTLRFRYAEGEIEAGKTFTFRDPGLVGVSAFVRRGGAAVPCRLTWGPGLGNPTEAERDVRGYQPPHGVALVGKSVERFPVKKLGPSGEDIRGPAWVGIESQYFAALFIPGRPGVEARIQPLSQPSPAGGEPVVSAQAVVPTGSDQEVLLYVGAKDHEALQRLGFGLQKVVPVGEWIGPVAVLLMRLLRWVHGHVGNWGWAIVLVTLLINVVMAPLRHYSIANSLKMARMSPEMKVIQERYRKVPLMDPRRQQMQEEMGALYARHGMSMSTQMLVGCLPLLITMPFLIAFYRVLAVSIELRGAPFLWISDLSQKDPLFLTPVLMGVSMYAMQKMTPTTMDPSQQRIMMLMPVMLAGMFLWAPAGLNLYWLTANLWSIAQQIVEMRVLRPAEAVPSGKKERKKR
jgi:YidC/Oxa1 family membrane protein insertase